MDPLIDGGSGNASSPLLTTERLVLHTWSDSDADGLYRISNDPQVMRHFPGMMSRDQVAQWVERDRENLAAGRPGLFAVSLADGGFIGFVGLVTQTFDASFTPCVEIGWRLAKESWGRGYATEAAREVLKHGFGTLNLSEIVSLTAVINEPSIAVMRRLGMHSDPAEDFYHPRVPEGDPLRRHVLYRLRADEWQPD